MFNRKSIGLIMTPFPRRSYTEQSSSSFYDIIISGGGMVGQTMACALAKNPCFKKYRIVLIESSPEKKYHPLESFSNRVSSIIPSSKDLFLKLGMWKNIRRYQEVKEMKVWGSYSHDYVDFIHNPANTAFIIENDEIVNAAVKENSSAPGVKVMYGKSIKKVLFNSSSNPLVHEVHLNDNSSLKTNLLIGADGANSSIRNEMGVNYISWKYNQFGIVATLKLADETENNVAWQKFLPDGPIALLPLEKGLSSLVWSNTEKKAKDLIQLPEEIFVNALNEALGSDALRNENVNLLNNYSKSVFNLLKLEKHKIPLIPPYVSSIVSGSRAMFPLSFGHSSEYVKPGVALIGDSAHKIHPLAGQGVNLGFRDIRSLEENLSQGILDGRPLGHINDLKHYETTAQRTNIPIMAATDLCHRVYTSDSDLIRALGNSCIQVAENIPLIKKAMTHLASS